MSAGPESPSAPAPAARAVGDPERRKRDHALNGKPSPDIARDVVAGLVGEHRPDLLRLEAAHERVEEKDAPGPAETCHGGINGPAPARLVGDPHADGGDAGALRQPEEPRPEIPSARGVSR
jgi:hypothetical protein